MNLHNLLSSRDLIDTCGNVRMYPKLDCYDDIFRVVTDFCYISATKGLYMGTVDGISSMTCDFDDKYTEDLFCIFIRGVCNAVDAKYVSFLIDDYFNTYASKCEDNIRKRVIVLSMLLKELLNSFGSERYIDCLKEISLMSTLMTSNEVSNYCFDLISKLIELVKDGNEDLHENICKDV